MSRTLTPPTQLAPKSTVATVPESARPKVRDPFLDNARFWVMLLVVIGHAITYLLQIPAARGLYAWIFTFHMPVFVLVSGYASRHYEGTPHQLRRALTTLLVPYVVANVALDSTHALVDGRAPSYNLLTPAWATWFLIAMLVWRLTSPIWKAIRWPVPVACSICLIGGLWNVDDVLGIHRMMGLLPFYVAGMFLRREHFDWLASRWFRIVSLVGLATAFVICQLQQSQWTLSWLYWRDAYAREPLNAGAVGGILIRGGLLVLGFAMCAGVLALVPRGRSWFSAYGTRTMYCYLTHGFFLILLAKWGVFGAIADGGVVTLAAVALGGSLAAVALMTEPVARFVRPVVEPNLSWFFRPLTSHHLAARE